MLRRNMRLRGNLDSSFSNPFIYDVSTTNTYQLPEYPVIIVRLQTCQRAGIGVPVN